MSNSSRKYRGRYSTGTLVKIPHYLGPALRKFKKETAMSPKAIALSLPKDRKGLHVSAHAISNLLNNDVTKGKKIQERVGGTLLGHLAGMLNEHGIKQQNEAIKKDDIMHPDWDGSGSTPPMPTAEFSDETLPIPYELVNGQDLEERALSASELIDNYDKISKADQVLLSAVARRLKPVVVDDPRVKQMEKLIDMAEALEAQIALDEFKVV